MVKKKKQRNRDFQSFWDRIRFKYKLSFFNEGSLEEVWSFRMSLLTFIYILTAFAVVVIVITSLIIIKTPIRNYLPGYLDVEVRQEIMQNALRADSLENIISAQSHYLNNVTAILTGTMSIDSVQPMDSTHMKPSDFNIPRSKEEVNFVDSIEEEEKYNLTALPPTQNPTNAIFFCKPVKGVISARFDPSLHHYGIDLVAAPKESVLAVLDGTVVFTGYDPEYGNIIQIQHPNGFLSIDNHNELLLKQMGDKVVAGEAIAIIGNTGKLSTGPHLHFELWYKGNPVNPEEYISF
jgi:hypothetical protein